MALTIGTVRPFPHTRGEWAPGEVEGYVDITFDNSYPTGGEAIAATDIDADFEGILGMHQDNLLAGIAVARNSLYDGINKKLILMAASGAEVANATDCSTVVIRYRYRAY